MSAGFVEDMLSFTIVECDLLAGYEKAIRSGRIMYVSPAIYSLLGDGKKSLQLGS